MSKKNEWENFKTLKERGEWVELQFMAAASLHGYHVLKPWGDSRGYDVGIEHHGDLVRVQIKSTIARNGTGYLCQFHRNYLAHPYTLDELDLFAAYVIPEQAWYLIPAAVILLPKVKKAIMLCPITARKQDRYKYEHYRELWDLLQKTREELNDMTRNTNKNQSGRAAL